MLQTGYRNTERTARPAKQARRNSWCETEKVAGKQMRMVSKRSSEVEKALDGTVFGVNRGKKKVAAKTPTNDPDYMLCK